MNDINFASGFQSILYADDTTLITLTCDLPLPINGTELERADIINCDLAKICDWLAVNKLSLNTKKTKYMTFHWPQNLAAAQFKPILKIQNQVIEKVSKNFSASL